MMSFEVLSHLSVQKLVRIIRKLTHQRDSYRNNYWESMRNRTQDRREQMEDDDLELKTIIEQVE